MQKKRIGITVGAKFLKRIKFIKRKKARQKNEKKK